jgi:hypothetical protein
VISLADIVRHPQVFVHQEAQNSGFHLALILAVVARVIAVIAVMTGTFVLLRTKEWVWVERVWRHSSRRSSRITLWTLYFSVSERVRRVFFRPTIGRQNAEL